MTIPAKIYFILVYINTNKESYNWLTIKRNKLFKSL